ncbi:MAG TPA: MMPL family transporter [Actinomycetota bacterium]|nr:MMPL family transporter [Actinomycetota bacterium]
MKPRSETRLGRLARFSYTRRRLVLVLWIVGLIVVSVLSVKVGNQYANKFTSGNTESARAQHLLSTRFPAAAGDSADVVVHTTAPLSDPANQADVAKLVASLTGLPHVSSVVGPAQNPAQISPNGHTAYAVVQFDAISSNLPLDSIKTAINTANAAAHPGFEVEEGGPPIDLVDFAVPGKSEGIGVGAAIIILLVAFGSVVAMGLPIIVALLGVGIDFGLLALVSHRLSVPTFGPELAAMIGIGVGIDYALFIVTRYRQGLHDGLDPESAVVLSLTTSGRAVLFAGCTVVISLLGLMLMGTAFVVGLAVGAILAVLLVLAGTMTLLPALLGFFGHGIDKLRLFRQTKGHKAGRQTVAYRYSREIQRHPWFFGVVSLAVLVVLALPLFSMRQALTDDSNAPTTLTTRRAYDLLAAGFGPGSNGPLVVAIDIPAGANVAAVDALYNAFLAEPDVAHVVPPRYNAQHNAASVIILPKSAPEAAQTYSMVKDLRANVIPKVVRGSGLQVYVGGEEAGGIDFSTQMSSRLPIIIGLVVALSFLLLMVVFRSVAVPIKAAIMNMLSIGAAYGVVVAVFQWGWLGGLIGIGKVGPIDPWVPLFLFTILFGLSMDYEVFLLSRIREEWLKTGDSGEAVADGLAFTARVITAAAAIMVCVFGSFVIGDPLRVLKLFGLGLATAVFIDATLVRMVLVPATMELLGRANWWLPRWLDRILPHLDIEGGPEELLEQPEPAAAP